MSARAVLAPLDPPLQTASGEVPTAPLVLIDVTASDGVVGHAYLFCYTPMVLPALTSLVEELGAAVAGTADAPRAVEADLRARLRLLRPQGLATMAISGLDMALWDVLARRARLPLVRLLGGEPRPVRAYGSLRRMAPEEVRAEAGKLAELGFDAYKVKVGSAGLARDREVIAALREAVGPDADIAVDFNQSLPVPEAIRRVNALAGEHLMWVEEPTRADDAHGHARIRSAVSTPIQLGESWWAVDEMNASIAAGASDHAMLDVARIGGVTGWLRAAPLAHAAGLPVSSHFWPEISAALLTVTPGAFLLEYLDMAAEVLRSPARVVDGAVVLPDEPGSGVEWDEDAVDRYRA
ncbi:enolase C-terminal domain-like protein [Actinomycetospora termitidis]|uniref:Enolase C-terminal domain-like protein n=1 Tax=Actinomycetospora termitidis TaxID=3053470 RepID=A0ABT7MJK6_9PSEU|nr:enolase C-terminal domain-like protein [Actinomycetospora sp. Odt1-22]MDL5160167.1 enolase C-terminal domain-like protein [Actinomycetospora sp. Odt1-22]